MHIKFQHLHKKKKIHPIYSSNNPPLNHSNHVLENRCFKSLNLEVEWSWKSMLEAFHWLNVAAVSMAILHAPWFPNLLLTLSKCSGKYYLVWGKKKKMGQIIIIYLASDSNRNREDHVWALLCSGLQFARILSSTFIYAYFLRPLLLINICYKEKYP